MDTFKPPTKSELLLLEKQFNPQPSQKEAQDFDNWYVKIKNTSMENSLKVSDVNKILNILPQIPKATDNKINLFFTKKDGFKNKELSFILKNFITDNNFEISIVLHSQNTISIGIGSKVRNNSTIFEENTEYFGHCHPTGFDFDNADVLPISFLAGILPSHGDLKGYLNNIDVVENSTRIFSKYGYSKLTFHNQEILTQDFNLEKLRAKYLKLFLGENPFNMKDDDDIIKSFKDELGIDLEFHYFNK